MTEIGAVQQCPQYSGKPEAAQAFFALQQKRSSVQRSARDNGQVKLEDLTDLSPEAAAVFNEVLWARRSVRAYRATPVPRPRVEQLLAQAARAPSGANMQPWRVHVLTGAALARVTTQARALAAERERLAALRGRYQYYPSTWKPAFRERRREVGLALYQALGIQKGDEAAMQAQHLRNFEFFGAPVGLLFTVDQSLTQGSWLDLGMFLQSLMLAATADGLHTCAQAAWCHFHEPMAQWLQFDADEVLVCGMALGHADPEAIENTLVTSRVPVSEFSTFHEE